MLYKKNNTKQLNIELFRNPTAEYRGTPFWAWNCKLEQKELEWQLEILKKMGFGGVHMHARSGLATPYLGEEYMNLVKACVAKCRDKEMLAWLYDEDRCPSGTAGGLVTKDKRYSARYLLFTPTAYSNATGNGLSDQLSHAETGTLLGCYDVELDENGYLLSFKVIGKDETPEHEKWYAYMKLREPHVYFNDQAYVNTLDKKAVSRFIEITYEAYSRTIADEFGKTVPAIFTDEPQFTGKSNLTYGTEKKDVILPWTDDLPGTFAAAYGGEDLLGNLPELIWDRADGSVSVIRYHYHDHICERFVNAFSDNLGEWCNEHGIALTGHLMLEDDLKSQNLCVGECMRSYRKFQLPGLDVLCARFEYIAAKQTQSAVHQFGREGMLSELYGVTNWDFDFRDHKLHGDWQAALGVTIRVPHLSWVSMAGEAKRDYPASINYQSPWWDQYSVVEDHFARVNTAMTRGKALVKVGIIHPIESYWLHWGPAEQTALVRDTMDSNFQNLTKWLLFGGIDFDFISESLLPQLCPDPAASFTEQDGVCGLKVGEMAYDVILVPGCETLRSTTLDRLEAFKVAGGKIVFAGELPYLEDARPCKRGANLVEQSLCVPFNRGSILEALESARVVEIRNQTGALTDNLLHQIRQDGDGRWLFIAHGTEPYNKDISRFQDLRIRVAGYWKVTLYDTMAGDIKDIAQCIKGDSTEIYSRMYDYDSLLLWLEPVTSDLILTQNKVSDAEALFTDGNKVGMVPDSVCDNKVIDLPLAFAYTLYEPNVLLLDQAEYTLDDGEWQAKEEILRVGNNCRAQLGWPIIEKRVIQPWAVAQEPITHTIHLRWHITSDIEYTGARLAIEDAERLVLKWNGETISNEVTGWYVDKSIKTVALPPIQIGDNVLEASIPFGRCTSVEWAYLLGDFGVVVCGRNVRITALRKEISFGDITKQGLPFYGGNITYHVPVETTGGNVTIRSNRYKGAMQSVSVDGGVQTAVIYPPYKADLGILGAGKHTIDITLYGHRRNSFGPVHLLDLNEKWIGPGAWRSKGEAWCYDYMICEEGVLNTPEITESK